MKDKNFLLKVLGLSGVPRVFTFLFTVFTFPIMLRQVGATEYGIIVFLSSIILIFESFADFGVSSAAGKEIANARVHRPNLIIKEIFNWSKFQLRAALVGLIPMAVATYYLAHSNTEMHISNFIIALTLVSSWVTIMSNFARAILTAILSFKSLALLDTVESVSRSSSFLFVAFCMPNALGLAIASIAVGLFIAITAFVTMFVTIREYQAKNLVEDNNSISSPLSENQMFKESLNFLWLRLATRCFSGLPIFILGHQFNSGIVGVVGTIQRMVDLLTFPFAVMGNALSVKGKELINKGNKVVESVWEVIFRVQSLAIIQWAITLVGSGFFSAFLFTNEKPEGIVFAVLTITVLTTSISVLVNPLTDYVGALKKRNILLSIVSFAQVPVIFLFGNFFGVIGAISAYVFVLLFINIGYLHIALKSFFPYRKYSLRPENVKLIIVILYLLVVVLAIQQFILKYLNADFAHNIYLYSIVGFLVLLSAVVMGSKKLRTFYITTKFFEYNTL
jgi:O-antigen/teichoic acid export membrane protein